MPSIFGLTLGAALAFYGVAMPKGMGMSMHVVRIEGRLLDAGTGAPLSDVWVTVHESSAAEAPAADAARTEVLGRVVDARRNESARRAEREKSPARRPEIDALPWIDTARTGPDGTFRFELPLYSCRAVGGLFTREDEPFVPPRYRSLWAVAGGDLMASVDPGATVWRPEPAAPADPFAPVATLPLGDVRIRLRR